jgi:hypothetical protein
VNQKKCPKCGENNPVEAVMCWACYTPLSGSAAAGTSGTGPPGGPASAHAGGDTNKKAIAPWQIGVIGAAILVVAGMAFMSMRGPDTPEYPTTGGGSGGSIPEITFPPQPNPSTVQVDVPAPTSSSGAPAPAPQPPYTITTSPSTKSSVATVGMVPNQPVSAQQAAALAAGMKQRLRGGPWRSMHVYVFADQAAAREFNEHQRGRDGAPLGLDDYKSLQSVWQRTLARYENNGGAEGVRYPQSNPSGWWYGGGVSSGRRAR